jgi:SAM-dependent methyltransferase
MGNAVDGNRAVWTSRRSVRAFHDNKELFPAERAALGRFGTVIKSARVLDMRIGKGRTTGHLARQSAQYVGIDYSGEMVRYAKANFPDVDLRVMDARDLSTFPDASFEIAIFSYNGIDYAEHVDRLLILREIHRVLVPGGVVLFSSHNRNSPIAPASAISNLELSANPWNLVKGLFGYASGLVHSARMRRFERYEADYALRNDCACRYRLLTYYITPEAQRAQLEQLCFRDVVALDLAGARVEFDHDRTADFMIHYLARTG